MKTFLLIAAFLLAQPASAGGVFQYVEVGSGRIYLAPRCLADSVHECNCAIAGPGVVPSFDDAFMCWVVDDKKIIFTSDKYRFEKSADDIQTEIEPTTPPPSSSPSERDPIPSAGKPS